MIYFTSDPHFFHSNVISYCKRPFSAVEEMNEGLISKWNEVITNQDSVYVLGDFSLAFRSVETILPRLNGTKYLIPGNHDFCHQYNKKSRNQEKREYWISKYIENGFNVLPLEMTMEIPELITSVKLCHFPYVLDPTYDDKFKKFRPIDDGTVLLCGHIHEKWLTKISDKNTLMINVGVDVWSYKPVSCDDINSIILNNQK